MIYFCIMNKSFKQQQLEPFRDIWQNVNTLSNNLSKNNSFCMSLIANRLKQNTLLLLT